MAYCDVSCDLICAQYLELVGTLQQFGFMQLEGLTLDHPTEDTTGASWVSVVYLAWGGDRFLHIHICFCNYALEIVLSKIVSVHAHAQCLEVQRLYQLNSLNVIISKTTDIPNRKQKRAQHEIKTCLPMTISLAQSNRYSCGCWHPVTMPAPSNQEVKVDCQQKLEVLMMLDCFLCEKFRIRS